MAYRKSIDNKRGFVKRYRRDPEKKSSVVTTGVYPCDELLRSGTGWVLAISLGLDNFPNIDA